MMSKSNRVITGYTLLELVIAIVIMSIIAASIVRVQYSTNSDRIAAIQVIKSVLEQCREVAIAHNGLVKVEFKDEKIKVKVVDSDGDKLEVSDLSAILSAAPSSMSEFEVELVRFAPQLNGVEISGQLTNGSDKKDVKFIETGALNNGKDVIVTLKADHFNGDASLMINGFTGLIEIQ